MPAPAQTLHSLEAAFWSRMPMPVAEIGLRLQPDGASYVSDVMGLSWAAMLVALWIDVAARRAGGTLVDGAAVRSCLDRSSHGKVATLLQRLADPAVSWNLEHRDDAFAGVCQRQRLPGTRVRDAIEAVVALRNRWAHHKLPTAEVQGTAEAMEQAIRRLLELHASLRDGRLVYVDRVERRDADEFYAAIALCGGLATPFRKGQWIPAPSGLRQGRVFLRREDTGALVDLSPFVHFDKGSGGTDRCVVLSEVRETKRKPEPVWMSVASAVPYARSADLAAELAAILESSSDPTVEDEVPVAAGPPGAHADDSPNPVAGSQGAVAVAATDSLVSPSTVRRWATPVAGLVLIGLGGSCLLVAIVGLFAARGVTDTTMVALAGNPPSASIARTCEVSLPQGRSATDLPSWLTGADVRWGESIATFDGRCRPYQPTGGACSISAGRLLTPTRESGLTGVSSASAAFDTRSNGGMFEITLQSTDSPESSEASISRAWGVPSDRRGNVRIWRIGDVRMTLAGARSSLQTSHGYRSTVVARFEPLSDVFYRDRERVCPP